MKQSSTAMPRRKNLLRYAPSAMPCARSLTAELDVVEDHVGLARNRARFQAARLRFGTLSRVPAAYRV